MVSKKEKVLDLPKNFDVSKLEAIGVYSLEKREMSKNGCGIFRNLEIFLMKYGNHFVYIPNISMKSFKEISPEIFQLFVEWCPFNLFKSEMESNTEFSSIYFNKTHQLLPKYQQEKKMKTFYNLFTYKNRNSEKNYHIRYGIFQEENKTYTGEHLYQKNQLISPNIKQFNHYQDVSYKKGDVHHVLDMKAGKEVKVNYAGIIKEVTKNNIVAVDIHYRRDEEYYSYRVIRKKDTKTVYNKNENLDSMSHYLLIGDRYFTVDNFKRGVLDLETGETISYPFENTCDNFICHVTKTEFTDKRGNHPISELPDLYWTGYETTDFIKKFKGFIPSSSKVGNTALNGTGFYSQYKKRILVFKDLQKGVFYKRRNELVNLLTGKSYKVDKVMLSWIEKNNKIAILDKKPKDIHRFSILKSLIEGKEIEGLYFGTSVLLHCEKRLETNFLKEKVSFEINKITDIKCTVHNEKVRIEIECEVKGKKIIFETDTGYEIFEVANIA